ncbi:RHS repeat-associated core domain-containing protein [Desulfosporosinus nitroreducens]|uniref:RHS repeat-associated core domain-containing protein n=1 Tax=Desulfosporosinus nitroreducens TaxID=2018668 RepID=UPI00207C5271|nr:RHS repeat-associated core domain-containing protein [Desulfosporosinus nitroreducens]MCO1600065.1 hypothetical protein [Desulfosporosinus nitroreducens]
MKEDVTKPKGLLHPPYTATDIQPPANAVYARIMAITYQGATGYFDNLQFEQSPQIRGYNALQNYTYAGYRYDKETGLYFLNARYYNAGIGRFLLQSPV